MNNGQTMSQAVRIATVAFLLLCAGTAIAQDGLVPAFELRSNEIELKQTGRPYAPFDKVGRKFALLGFESGSFEAWAYPLKLFRNFEFSFLLGSSTRPLKAADVLRYVSVTPEATVLTYTYQSFTVRAIYVTPVNEAGAIIFLDVHSTEPLTIVCGFIPVLQPMWPAGIGGQYCYWDDNLKAYIISESSSGNHGLLGSPAASGISYTPAHMLSDNPIEFKIEIKDPRLVADKFIPIYMAGGKGKFQAIKDAYANLQKNPQRFYTENADYYKNLKESTLQVVTPHKDLNLAFEWAKVAYDNLTVDNPDLGKGMVAGLGASGTGGRPGFGWFFGGDTYINSFSLDSYCNYQAVKHALAFTQKTQREDGKMAHELSQAAGYIDWFGKYHFGYIHGDTTPFYITAMYDYFKMSGDASFVKQSWKSVTRAYDWCHTTDANADGLMDNRKAGLAAMEFGPLRGIETDIYLAAVWVRAAYAMQFLARVANDTQYEQQAIKDYQQGKKAFEEKLWHEKGGYYSYAFNAKGEQVNEVTPWSAPALVWEVGDSVHSVKSLEKLSSSELTTDWGVRSLSNKSQYYDPLNYNYGAVWPFIGSWVATAQYKHRFAMQGYTTLMAAVRHTFDNQLGAVSEVFSGATNVWLQEAVSHQGFSSAAVALPFVRGMLGLEGDAMNKVISFTPYFPADWETVAAKNYRTGNATISFDYERKNESILLHARREGDDGYRLKFAPALGVGTEILSVTINGKQASFEKIVSSQTMQPVVLADLKETLTTIEISFKPTVELLAPESNSKTGDLNRGLKVLSVKQEDKKLRVEVEGLSGETYTVKALHRDLISNVEGAGVDNEGIKVKIPAGKSGEFVRHAFTVFVKK